MSHPASIATVNIDHAMAGMVLAADLADAGGNVLLPSGATLSDATLKSLRRRGIEELTVVSDEEDAADAAAAQAERERQLARLDRLFRRSADIGATGKLKERLRAYRMEG